MDHSLHDILRIHHKNREDLLSTYARGIKRLDYALGAVRVLQAVRKAGYEPFNHRLFTDYWGFFIELNAASILSSDIQTLAPYPTRGLKSNNVQQVSQYLRLKHRMLTSENVFQRAKKLNSPVERHQFAERLDKDILCLSLAAEKMTIKFREPAWSQALQQQRIIVSALSKTLSMART